MSHSNNWFSNRIWTDKPVYGDSPIGNLEVFMVSNMLPLQQGFDGNIHTRLSIGVHDNSAFLASEQGIISTVMSLTNSTAVVAELRCMPRINYIQRNILVKTPLHKVTLKSKERNPHDFTIKSLSFRTEPFKVLNGNISIVSQGKVGNAPYDFSYSVLDKIMFISFSPVQCLVCIGTSGISITLEQGLPLKYLLSFNPNILTEIILMQNLPFRRDDGNCKALAININSKNILLQRQYGLIFREICDNLQFRSQPIGLACPSSFNQVRISLEIAILGNGDCNAFSWINPQFNEWHSLGKGLAVAWNIEFDSNPFDLSFTFPNSTFTAGINLNVESSSCFGFCKGLSVELHEFGAGVPFIPQEIELAGSLHGKVSEEFMFPASNIISLQKNSASHTANHIYMLQKIYDNNYSTIPPTRKRRGLPCRD